MTASITSLTPILLALAHVAHAASPFVTDDVSVLDRGACQLEVWQQNNRDSRDLWVVPACSPIDRLEVSFGGSRTTEDGATRTTNLALQAKYVVRDVNVDSWGWGWVAGGVWHPDQENGRFPGDPYALLMAGASFNDDSLRLNVNLGGLHERETGRNLFTWGFLAEQSLAARFKVIGEVFGTQYNRPFYQAGARASLIPDRLELDATVGNRFGRSSDERWWTISIRIITDPLK
jgi:hypothetical protein